MFRSVRTKGKGMECGASYGVDYKETKKEGAGPSFLVGCIWDDG